MDVGLFVGICFASLGVAAFFMLVFSLGLVIRATTRHKDAALKWDSLTALQDADQHVQSPRQRDERIQQTSDQTQRGDA